MLPAHLHDPRLDLRVHLMRTRQRPRAAIGQPAQPVGRVPPQPLVHRLARHPITAGHIGDRRPVVEHLQHRLIALFHQAQLHEHRRPPPDLRARTTHSEEGGNARRRWTSSVSQEPGPLSPRYRGRVPKLSPSYRGHDVHHEPGPHTRGMTHPQTFRGDRPWDDGQLTLQRLANAPEGIPGNKFLERTTGFEPATLTLGKASNVPARDRSNRWSPASTSRVHRSSPLQPLHSAALE